MKVKLIARMNSKFVSNNLFLIQELTFYIGVCRNHTNFLNNLKGFYFSLVLCYTECRHKKIISRSLNK